MTSEAGIIRRLDEVVVNRIAAGEVIQRPANALKEMLENSLDAGAGTIQVIVKEGGLKLLQIQDTGCGIRKEDMEIVCERFTTSKLSKFEDLQHIATFGFRGEALASISHVAHVTITTRTIDSKSAWRGEYCDGKLKSLLKPCAGSVGTQIMAEDLFYNVPTRRKALKNPSEEHSRIIEVVSRYAVHNPAVGFILKKHGEGTADIRTSQNSTTVDNIRTIFGSAVTKELLEIDATDSQLKFTIRAYLTNGNYSVKKTLMLLFINNRLVDSTAIKKVVDAVYTAYLPKGNHPFIYLSLQIAPENVDVNVHPTKHEVHFLHEEAIADSIQRLLGTKLMGCNLSRIFVSQSLLSGGKIPSNEEKSLSTGRVYEHELVRTDSKLQKIDMFLQPQKPNATTMSMHNAADPLPSNTIKPGLNTDKTGVNVVKTGTNTTTNSGNVHLSAINNEARVYSSSLTNQLIRGINVELLTSNPEVPSFPVPVASPADPVFTLNQTIPEQVISTGHTAIQSENTEDIADQPGMSLDMEVLPVANRVSFTHVAQSVHMCMPALGRINNGIEIDLEGLDFSFMSSDVTKPANQTSAVCSSSDDTTANMTQAATSCDQQLSNKNSSEKRKRPDSDSFDNEAVTPMTHIGAPVRRDIKLTSVLNIREEIKKNYDTGLLDMFKDFTFVGCMNPERCVIQHRTGLYVINVANISRCLFYQLLMENFGNFGIFRLSEPAPIYNLALMALEAPNSTWTEGDGAKDELAKYVVNVLTDKADMLEDYFSMKIDKSGNLLTLPRLLESFIPQLENLPSYVLRLATEVNWSDEAECFKTFAQETAEMYILKKDWIEIQEPDEVCDWPSMIENVLLPSFRSILLPPKHLSDDCSIIQVADLHQLYKVFERC